MTKMKDGVVIPIWTLLMTGRFFYLFFLICVYLGTNRVYLTFLTWYLGIGY